MLLNPIRECRPLGCARAVRGLDSDLKRMLLARGSRYSEAAAEVWADAAGRGTEGASQGCRELRRIMTGRSRLPSPGGIEKSREPPPGER